MSTHDQYSGQQVRFLRADPTGRIVPLSEAYRKPSPWPEIFGGLFFGLVVAFIFYLGV